MLQSLSVVNGVNGATYNYSFDGSLTAPGVVTSMSDLGPTSADVATSAYSAVAGSAYKRSRIPQRAISMEIVVVEDPSDMLIETSRVALYEVFDPGAQVLMTIVTDRAEFSISGVVEKCEPAIFSEQVAIEVSLICPDPYWYKPDNVTSIVDQIDGGFTFPFNNPGDFSQFVFLVNPRDENGQRVQMYELGYSEEQLMFNTNPYQVRLPNSVTSFYANLASPSANAGSDARASMIANGYISQDEIGSTNEAYWTGPTDIETDSPHGPRLAEKMVTDSITTYNNSVVIEPGLVFGELKERVSATVSNGGAENGFTVSIALLSGVGDIPKIKIATDTAALEIDMAAVKNKLGRDFRSSDTLIVRTVSGNRFVHIVDVDGNVKSCLNSIGSRPSWPTIPPGGTDVFVTIEGKDRQDNIRATITFAERYTGV